MRSAQAQHRGRRRLVLEQNYKAQGGTEKEVDFGLAEARPRRIWREATERGGDAAGRRFRTIIFVYLLLRKIIYLRSPSRSSARARPVGGALRRAPVLRRRPPRARTPRCAVRASGSPVSTPH